MAKDLYRSYCAKDAVDRIKFDEDIVSELAEGKVQAQFVILTIYQKKIHCQTPACLGWGWGVVSLFLCEELSKILFTSSGLMKKKVQKTFTLKARNIMCILGGGNCFTK